jgi:uncharacterized Fe-S cluster protein YjdI/CDGSH-type Zn-finger protein
MKERTIRYCGRAMDVYFTIDRCTHVAECLNGAPEVFDVMRRPWIIVDNSDPDFVAEVIIRCPTGALHFKRKDGGAAEPVPEKNTIAVCKNGPYYVHGDIEIRNSDNSILFTDTRLALCRCGASSLMPLCDGSHEFKIIPHDSQFQTIIKDENPDSGKLVIILRKNAALEVQGPVDITDPADNLCYRGSHVRLCRCGASMRMP